MLASMLPEAVSKELRVRNAALYNTHKIKAYLTGGLSRYSDKHLCHTLERVDGNMLGSAPKNPINSLQEAEKRMGDMTPPSPPRVLTAGLHYDDEDDNEDDEEDEDYDAVEDEEESDGNPHSIDLKHPLNAVGIAAKPHRGHTPMP